MILIKWHSEVPKLKLKSKGNNSNKKNKITFAPKSKKQSKMDDDPAIRNLVKIILI